MNEEIMTEEKEITDNPTTIENDFDNDNDPEWDNVVWGKDEDLGDDAAENSQKDSQTSDLDDSSKHEEETPASEGASDEQNDKHDDTDQYFELKHFDEVRKVTKDEAKTLAQKGLDYDRVRSERDTMKADYEKLKGYESFLNELKGDFGSIEELMDDTRAKIVSDKENISYEDAMSKVKSNHREQKSEHSDNSGQVDRFVKAYPDVKAADIPESVWEEVRSTGDLVAAYSRYEKSKLNEEITNLKNTIETMKNNEKNAQRSAGSSKSSGNASNKSLIASLWDDDD